MIFKNIKTFEQHIQPLNERLMNVDDDVEMIYNKYFEEDIDKLRAIGYITPSLFSKSELNTSDLISPLSKKVHKINPCHIFINRYHNFYDPLQNVISFSINHNAINLINHFDNNINKAYNSLGSDEKKRFMNEFNPSKIKGSIHHELTHWIDDTLHNRHIKNRSAKADETGSDMSRKGIPIQADKVEIQGQIHNIFQLKKEFKDIWDELTFENLINLSTTLAVIDKKLKGDINTKWRKDLKKRMHREGLLGKNMISNN